ncbi:hypothetical protein [Mycobacterium sp.]|uniref:hypothetical protein n=1 Tax=Mycobacterium sp. TaxID=1785 RepID=UPI002625215B|nr:hypothetical protein [Mycobacterium sp.]
MVPLETEDPPQTAAAKALNAHRWAKVDDRSEATAPGRAALWQRFLDEVDPHRELPEDERTQRAQAARKRHYAELGRRSGEARRARRPCNIDEVVDQIVDAAPELSEANRARLQALLSSTP